MLFLINIICASVPLYTVHCSYMNSRSDICSKFSLYTAGFLSMCALLRCSTAWALTFRFWIYFLPSPGASWTANRRINYRPKKKKKKKNRGWTWTSLDNMTLRMLVYQSSFPFYTGLRQTARILLARKPSSNSKRRRWVLITRAMEYVLDITIRYKCSRPFVVIETGWSESRPRLYQDMQIWPAASSPSFWLHRISELILRKVRLLCYFEYTLALNSWRQVGESRLSGRYVWDSRWYAEDSSAEGWDRSPLSP